MIHLAALALYVAAFVLWLRVLLRGDSGRPPRAPGWALAGGVAAHTAALLHYALTFGELPLAGLAPSLSSLALVMGLGLLATMTFGEASRVGIVLVPFMILLEGVAATLGIRPAPADLDFQGWWLAFHVTLAFAGLGGMALAAAAGVLYLTQFHELKTKRLGKLFAFIPPLSTLDRVGRVGALAGFVLLTLSLVLGGAWLVRFRGSLGEGDPGELLWGAFSWLVIGLALLLRSRRGGTAHGGALASAVGFGLIVLSYLALRIGAQGSLLFL